MRIYLLSCFFPLASIIPASIIAQKISGRVLNEGGRAAYYVTVQFRNKASAVFTNEDGTFSITASKLPDTLFFSAPGFEPYRTVVTEATAKDPNFEIVLLNTRRKIKSSDVNPSSIPVTNTASNGNGQGNSTTTSSGYIKGKRLLMIDTGARSNTIMYRSGLLAAGEVNDFNSWRAWSDFGEAEFKTHSDHWAMYPIKRYTVQLQNQDHLALAGEPVYLINKRNNDTIWSAVTDNTGKVELWCDVKKSDSDARYVVKYRGQEQVDAPILSTEGVNQLKVNAACSIPANVDIAVVVDATGSMNTEIDFLKIELEDVIRNTFAEYGSLDVRVASVFYRDKGDEYVTRHVDFQSDLVKPLNFIKLQRASGGGDVPEAVHTALQTALDSLHWSANARSRILFLVTDAPPHDEARDRVYELIRQAASRGIRIVPIICKGADKSTEFIMRSIAMLTNGDYVFLTDDSNAQFVSGAAGTDFFNVQYLNALLERIIKQMVSASSCDDRSEKKNIILATMPSNTANLVIHSINGQNMVSIEAKEPLKNIFVTDFTGKIVVRLPNAEKQNKWSLNKSDLPNGNFFIKYITGDNQWGAAAFEVEN